jgi:biopolymer transport protein ExbB
MMDWIADLFQKGGPFFVVDTIFLAISIAIIVERAIYFLGRGHINANRFLSHLKRLIAANDLDRAKKVCDADDAPIARVAKAGLSRMHKGEAAVAQAMEEAMLDVTPEVKTRIGALWSMANIMTLTGLIGTITGLIVAFSGVAEVNPAERQQQLSDGIAEALYNTAIGLIGALICMVAHLVYSTASKKILADLESFTLKFENLLSDGANAASGDKTRDAS